MRLKGKVAVVTGGANGIGAAISRRLHAEGAHVAIVDVSEPDLASLRSDASEGDMAFFPCEISSGEAVEQAGQAILSRFGSVSILVNNAGGSGKTLALTIEENSDEAWNYVMDLNVTSIIRFSRLFVPGMRQAKAGRIINISSLTRHGVVGRAPVVTIKNPIAYVTAKGAMVSLSKQMGRELGADGITCNAVAPGMILPDPEARVTKIIKSQPKEIHDAILGTIPLGRFGNGQDVAALVAFLASDEAEFVNGETIDVSGGA